jgi:hypothetical protein
VKPVALQYEPRGAAGGRVPRWVWPVALNLASAGAGAYFAWMAWDAVHWRGAENYAELGLVIVGIPVAIFFQVPVLCLSVWMLARCRDERWRPGARLLVALTAPLGLALPACAWVVAHLR